MRNRPLVVIFVTVFIDLVGFGMIIPLNPYLARQFGATPFQVGLLMTIYSLMQFLFSPFWGRLSDRIGRRPVILISLFGASLAHLWFAFGQSYTSLFAARLLAGLFGANISTAMAYIADVTPPKDRSKGMGLVGAAFGLGFLLGPFLGGVLGDIGSRLGDYPPFGPSMAAVGASLICFLNFLLALKVLHESKTHRQPRERSSRLQTLMLHFKHPRVGVLMLGFFLLSFGMANMEASMFMFVQDEFLWNMTKASFGFAYVGLVMVFTQGYLIRKMMPRFGESRLLQIGLLFTVMGFIGIGLSTEVWMLAVSVTFLGLGTGFANPSFSGLISVLTSKDTQGETLGITQSLSALGRILGPALGGWAYGVYGHRSPFMLAGALGLLSLGLVVRVKSKLPKFSHDEAADAEVNADPAELSIGAFQLLNLLHSGVPFALYYLMDQPADAKIKDILSRGEKWSEDFAKLPSNKEQPVILVCESGARSLALAIEIAKRGYKNVFAIEGGVGALAEA